MVDCRPADHYNAGHLPTAFHLDANLVCDQSCAFILHPAKSALNLCETLLRNITKESCITENYNIRIGQLADDKVVAFIMM